MIKYFILIVFSVLVFSCKQNSEVSSISFYHWKSNYKSDSITNEYLNKLEIDTLYIRFFDVVKSGRINRPVANIKFKEIPTQEIIPTVFITNETMIGLSEKEIKDLAKNISNRIEELTPKKVNTIQLDCDWTKVTQQNYFQLCREMKTYFESTISTIRLHQFRYQKKTGIPPVDKGVVMCYATENPFEETENSILSTELLKQYLSNAKNYPLKADYALPIYSWAVVENHINKHRLIHNVEHSDFSDESVYKRLNDNTYEVQRNTFFKGNQFSAGFKIRIENISVDLLGEAKQLIQSNAKEGYQLIYYHLDSSFLKQYETQQLK